MGKLRTAGHEQSKAEKQASLNQKMKNQILSKTFGSQQSSVQSLCVFLLLYLFLCARVIFIFNLFELQGNTCLRILRKSEKLDNLNARSSMLAKQSETLSIPWTWPRRVRIMKSEKASRRLELCAQIDRFKQTF